MEGFFDEKSGKWIKIYKGIIIVEFWLMIAAAAVLCIVGWSDELYWTDSAFIDGILALVAGCVGAVIFLVPNMLIIQLLNNVQVIREKMEIPVFHYNGNTKTTDEVTHPTRGTTSPSSVITCPSCGKTQYPGSGKCFSCGAALK